jgi:lipid-binding SYLF domain-containing protein
MMKRDICLIVAVSLLTSIPSALADDGTLNMDPYAALQGMARPQFQSIDSASAPATDSSTTSDVTDDPSVQRGDTGLPDNLRLTSQDDQVGPDTQAMGCHDQENSKDKKRREKEISKGIARYRAVMKVLGDVRQSVHEGIADAPTDKGLSKLLDDDKKIPAALGKNASCIAIIPSKKTASLFGYGAEYGAGMYTCDRIPGTQEFDMSKGHFIQFKGGSFGFQAGVKETDQVLLFTGKSAAQSLANGSFQIGAAASATGLFWGRDASASLTNGNYKSPVYSYSHSEGWFAGVSFNGGRLTTDNAMEASMHCLALPKPKSFFQKLFGWLHHKAPQNSDTQVQVSDSSSPSVGDSGTSGAAAPVSSDPSTTTVTADSAGSPAQDQNN